MKTLGFILLIAVVVQCSREDGGIGGIVSTNNFSKGSELIKKFLEHFKNPDSMHMPLPIPDPLVMPDRVYMVAIKISTTNVTAFGVSRIRVENFTSDLVDMKIHFGLRMPKLVLMGNYSHQALFYLYAGGFNVTLLNAHIKCNAKLEVTRDGELAAADINMDFVSREKMFITVENAGVVGAIVNVIGDSLFSAIEPYFLSIISANIRSNFNDHLKQLKVMFPNSIPPLDLAIAECRKFAKIRGFDPQRIDDYQYATSIYSLDLTHIVYTGLSSFYRIGDVKVLLNNHIVHVMLNVGTEELEGSCNWEAGIAGILTKSGIASFTIDYIHVMVSVNQSLDLRRKAHIIDLSIKVGNIQLRMDGAGSLDYIAELGVNVLPNILRDQIVQAAEKPIRRKIQEAIDNVDLERLILDNVSTIDEQLDKTNRTVIEDDFAVIEDTFAEKGPMIKETNEDQELIL